MNQISHHKYSSDFSAHYHLLKQKSHHLQSAMNEQPLIVNTSSNTNLSENDHWFLYSFCNDFLVHLYFQQINHNHPVKLQNHHHIQSHYPYCKVGQYKSSLLYPYMTFEVTSIPPDYPLQYTNSVCYPNPHYPLPPDAKSLL